MVDGEELVGGEAFGGCEGYSEKAFLAFVKALDVYGIHLVVGQDVHPVVADAEQEERNQGDDAAAGGAVGQKEGGDEHGQHHVLGAEADAEGRDGEPGAQAEDHGPAFAGRG